MVQQPWLWPRLATAAYDLVAAGLAWLGAFWLRFNLDIPPDFTHTAIGLLPAVALIQICAFALFRLDRAIHRFVSLTDLVRIAKASLAAVALSALVLFWWVRLDGIPRSVLILDALLLIFLLGGGRLLPRLLGEWHNGRRGSGQRALVVGAGEAGELLVRDLLRHSHTVFTPVGFLDDDRSKLGREILGVRVLGPTRDLAAIAQQYRADIVLFAIPSAARSTLRRLVTLCEDAGLPYRTLPSTHDLVTGQVTVSALREITLEDLLGRKPAELDWSAIQKLIAARTVLVTGAGGSIGSELCRQIARLQPRKLIALEVSEYALYEIKRQLAKAHPGLALIPVLDDIRNEAAMERLFDEERPDLVFHAAAYKHVPMLEEHPVAGIVNNVVGTQILADVAARSRTSKFIMISTDKAVNPANVMGATKRIAEIYCQNLDACSKAAFITTRFGNVLGSSGSVVPLFREQVASGGPVTVTHPDIERYFMTISEACQLVLQAAALGNGGEIFVLDMGEPVKIRELAEQIIRLSGLRPGYDIEIVYTGLRPGEKISEELFHADEGLMATSHAHILLAGSRPVPVDWLRTELHRLKKACKSDDREKIEEAIRLLVPEYRKAVSPHSGTQVHGMGGVA